MAARPGSPGTVIREALVEGREPTMWSEAVPRVETSALSCPTGSATVAPDARPHVRPISVCGLAALLLPHVGDIAEGRNLAADPRSALSVNRTVLPPLDRQFDSAELRCTQPGI